ncbi:unnamed protein product, partial [Tetraodon nigroviridis]
MATFISVPLKKSSEVDLVKPLSKFVRATYQTSDEQAEYIRAVEELNKLRKSAVGRPLDKHESSLEVLLRYYDQLCAVEPKFPFSENQVIKRTSHVFLCLTFTWKDAFDKGSLFGGSVKLALASLGYEKTCVLFNVAALASQIASEQNLDNDEGLKAAAKYYQLASGAFGHIQDTVLSALNRQPTMDISPETMGTLSTIMLAQAQEVIFLKAASDKMKDAVIAKLANQAADFYATPSSSVSTKTPFLRPHTGSHARPAGNTAYRVLGVWMEVLPVLAAKHCIMQANAEFYQSALANKKKHFGEEIARLQVLRPPSLPPSASSASRSPISTLPLLPPSSLQHAAELVKTVASRYDEYISVKDLSDRINRSLTSAKKENDFIYNDRVPDVKDLEHIGKAALVKAAPITTPLSQKFTDLFEKMVPMAVQQAMSIYNQRKTDYVNRLVGTMREATNLCNGVLASLNLPAALEDLSGDSIPQSIAEKARSIVQQGGLQSIEQLIKDLPELLTRNREILDEV